jgi:hypothetical protein
MQVAKAPEARGDAEAGEPLLSESERSGADAAASTPKPRDAPAGTAEAAPRQATVLGLLRLAFADWHLLALAFSCGAVAAVGTALLPYYTGVLPELPCGHAVVIRRVGKSGFACDWQCPTLGCRRW